MTSFENDEWPPAVYTNMCLPVNKRNTFGVQNITKDNLPKTPNNRKESISGIEISHLATPGICNVIQQLTNNSEVKMQRCDGIMFSPKNRRQEKYPYNSYFPSGGSWRRHEETSSRLFSNHNQNEYSTNNYEHNYGQNCKPRERKNWTCKYMEENRGKFFDTKFCSSRFKKRGTYYNSNINPRNNHSYKNYHQRPYKRYDENKQTYSVHKNPSYSQTSDSNGQRLNTARETFSTFKNESFFCKSFSLQKRDDDNCVTVDMNISDSENSNSRNQKRKSYRPDDDIPYKKTCYEDNVKTQSQTLRLKHCNLSDSIDDDSVGIERADVGQNLMSSGSGEYSCKKSSSLEKCISDSLSRKCIDSNIKGVSANAISLSTKNNCENLNNLVPITIEQKKNSAELADSFNIFKNPNLTHVRSIHDVSIIKKNSPESSSNVENKSASLQKCPKQHKIDKENLISSPEKNINNKTKKVCGFDNAEEKIERSKTALKKDEPPGSEKPDIIRKSQEKLKQFKNVIKSKYNTRKHRKIVIETCCPTDYQIKEKKKVNALSFDAQSTVGSRDNKEEEFTSKNKKIKLNHRKSTEHVKEIPGKNLETKSNDLNKDVSDNVIKYTCTNLEKQYTDDEVVGNKDSNKLSNNLSKQTTVVREAAKTAKKKDYNKSLSTSANQTSSVEKKSSKQNDNVSKKIKNKVKRKDSKDNNDAKSKKDKTDVFGKKISSNGKRPYIKSSTSSKNSANLNESTSNQEMDNDNSSKVCEKNSLNFIKEASPLEKFLKKALIQKVKAVEPIVNSEDQSKIESVAAKKTIGVSEDTIKPAKTIMQRRGKSCDARNFSQAEYLEPVKLKTLTRSKSIDSCEIKFTSFPITRSKSGIYGLFSGLSPVKRRSRSTSSLLVARRLEEDKREDNTVNKNNSDKASEGATVNEPSLMDMDHKKCITGYSSRDDDDEIAEHMTTYTSDIFMNQRKEFDPKNPRKRTYSKSPVKNGTELTKFEYFIPERFQGQSKRSNTHNGEQTNMIQNISREVKPVEQSRKSPVNEKDNGCQRVKNNFLKQRRNSIACSFEDENKKCARSNSRQIKKPLVGHNEPKRDGVLQSQLASKVNVRPEVIEGYFPSVETDKNCIRLNASNGKEECVVTIHFADVSEVSFIPEEANTLIIDPVISSKAHVSNIPDPLPETTSIKITIQGANRSEKVIDLTLDNPREEQSDLLSINNINKLTEQLLEIYGDEEKPSVTKSVSKNEIIESMNSSNYLLNILESPNQRENNEIVNEIDEAPAAPYTVTIKPLLPMQPNEEPQNITIEIPNLSTAASIVVNSHKTPEVVTTNCVTSQTNDGTLGNLETSRAAVVQKNPEVPLSNSKKTSANVSKENSSRCDLQFAVPSISNIVNENASKQDENVLSNSGTVKAGGPSKLASTLSNEDRVPSNSLPASNISAMNLPSFQPINQRRPSNKTVLPQEQAQPNSFADQQRVNQNLPVLQPQHPLENSGQRFLRDNLSKQSSEVSPNRTNSHTNENSQAYKDFLSTNVHYILKYQCVTDMICRSFPSYMQSIDEFSFKKPLICVVQSYLEKELNKIQRDMRRYYNSVKLANLKCLAFLTDLDSEMRRSGQKLFWKWNLEFLGRLLLNRGRPCQLPLNACYRTFLSDLKRNYETYVTRYRIAYNNSQKAQDNSTGKVVKSSNISVVPLAVLQDPVLHNSVLLTNNSNVQKTSSDQYRHQAILRNNNNATSQLVSRTSNQASNSEMSRLTSNQQQHIQLMQRNRDTVNSSVLPIPNQAISNQTVTNQTLGMTPQQLKILLQQIGKCTKLGLLPIRQSTPSANNCYIGGNMSGRSAYQRLSKNCKRLEHGGHQSNLLHGQRSSKDFSRNMKNMINANKSSYVDSGSIGSPGSIQHPPPFYLVHLPSNYQQNETTPPKPEVNQQRPVISLNSFTSLQQQQNSINLPSQNNESHRTEILPNDRVFNRVTNGSLRNTAFVPHSQSQIHACDVYEPRREADQNMITQHISTEVQNLNTLKLNTVNAQNIPESERQQATHEIPNTSVQQVTSQVVASPQTTITRQLSSDLIDLHTGRSSMQEQTVSPVKNNQVQQHSATTATQNEPVSVENNLTSDSNENPSIKEEFNTEVELKTDKPQYQLDEEFIDFEKYLSNTHGDNWNDDIEIIWPENYVVLPILEEVKNEDGQDGVENDPIPRSVSNDNGIELPTDIILPSQIQLPGSLYEDRFCLCGKQAIYVCTCKLQMYCSEECQNSDWQRHSSAYEH